MKYAWECLREFLIFIAFIAAAAAAQLAFSQDGAQSVLEQQHAAGTLEPVPVSTLWQQETQAKLDAAAKIAGPGNRNVAVVIEPGRYEFVSLRIPPHVILVGGSGWGSREVDLVYVGAGDETCITLDGGYSTGIMGVQIRTKRNNEPRVVGIATNNCINPVIANCRVDLRGTDTIGVQIAGRESLTISRLESRASVPIQYIWGDNIALHDCDLGASGNCESLPSTIVWLTSLPHQITFDGSFTAQGGDHLIYSVTDEERTGQSLALYNLRYEQSTSTKDPNKYAIDIRCNGRAFENLVLVNCRWTDRRAGISIVRNPAYPLGTNVTVIGSRLPGGQ